MGLKEYFIDDTAVHEWLPWGALVRKNVMRNKDESYIGILEYTPGKRAVPNPQDFPLKKGWSLWSERQHGAERDRYFLAVCWNPFWGKISKTAENTLHDANVDRRQAADYFAKELETFTKAIGGTTDCSVLEYQEILDFLSFSLSIGETRLIMPEIPIYLDVLLSRDLRTDFQENGITLNDKPLVAFSLPSLPRGETLDTLFQAFGKTSYRYVRRLLAFDHDGAKDEIKGYMERWCDHRGYVKKAISKGLVLPLSGYYSEQFFLTVPADAHERVLQYCRTVAGSLRLPFILEDFNLKDIWWGNLAGCFRANINPVITGFDSLGDFLIGGSREGAETDVPG